MMHRFTPLYPFLFVILPILNILTRNPGGSSLADSGGLMLLMLAACAVLYGALVFALRHHQSRSIAPLVVLAVVIWFYAYPRLRSAFHVSRDSLAHMALMMAVVGGAAVATVVLIGWLARRPRQRDRVNTFLALTGLLLVAFAGVRVVTHQLRARLQMRASNLAKELDTPLRVKDAVPAAPVRDIYLIVLDEYASSSVLRERFGFDNRAFEDSLRKLGFTVPRLVRTNYVHTLLSIPSLLNFSHLTRLAAELGARETDPTLPNHLVENNRTAKFLKARGYEFVFYPSQWWTSTEHNRNADREYQVWTGFDLGREATRSDMWRAFIGTTPLALLQNDDMHDADHVRRTLAALEELGPLRQPTFAFAHILNPHYPYVFDAHCKPHRTRPNPAWGRGRQEAYLEQVQCLNRLLLGTVTSILKRSSTPPVILLVGDHGTNSLGYSDAKSAETVSPAQARERFGAFGAFLVPGGGDRLFADTLTLVSVIPRVLNHYFDAGLRLPPDSLYMSLEHTPYLFAPVDPASLAPHR
jgi:hypothetical protein